MTTPGLEAVCAQELRDIGCREVTLHEGGVSFFGDIRKANLWLRSASRVLEIVGKGRARNFGQLARLCERVTWDEYRVPGHPVEVRVSCSQSRLYHDGAVAERVRAVLGNPPDGPDALGIHVRIRNDRLTLSVDSSGDRLHRRGYRLEPGLAPLRETLAAAVLLDAGWDGRSPLCDPMCGSGTFLIEGALIALGRPPGAERHFAWERWPRLAGQKRPGPPGTPSHMAPRLFGFDHSADAVRAARANAGRAKAQVTIELRDAATLMPPVDEPGLLVTNPPYGQRVGEGKAAFELVEALGERFTGWRIVALHALGGPTPAGWSERMRFRNGGLRVRVLERT